MKLENDDQYRRTQKWVKRFTDTTAQLEERKKTNGVNLVLTQAEISGCEYWISKLRRQLQKYEEVFGAPTPVEGDNDAT